MGFLHPNTYVCRVNNLGVTKEQGGERDHLLIHSIKSV